MVTLDEEGYVAVDIALGAYPGKQKVRVFATYCMLSRGYYII